MGSQNASEHAHRATGIAGIEHVGWRTQTSEASTLDAKAQAFRGSAGLLDSNAERPQAIERRAAITSG
jgi:hypothetical protein